MNNRMMRSYRLIAGFVLMCFAAREMVWAGPASLAAAPEEISIPAGLGAVEDRFLNSSRPALIVHIHDAHAHYEAQMNIRRLIGRLEKKHGFRLLLLEGGSGVLDPSLYRVFKEPALNLRLAENLVKEGELSGAEMHLIERMEQPAGVAVAYGIEDVRLYREDLALFRSIHAAKDLTSRFLEEEESRQSILGDSLFSASLRSAVREWQKFEQSGGMIRYAAFLEKMARRILNLDLGDPAHQRTYPQLIRLLRLRDLESRIRPRLAEMEKEKLSAWMRSFPEGAALAPRLETFSGGEGGTEANLRPRSLFEGLCRAFDSRGFRFGDYPAFSLLGQHRILQSEMDAAALFAEIARLTDSLLSALARNDRERLLLRRVKDLDLLKRLFRLELAREDYEKISKAPAAFRPASPDAAFLFDRALDFYRLAERREEAFVENVLRRMEGSGREKAVLVTGGFHGAGLARAFKERGISYLSVRPRMSGPEAGSGEKYLDSLLGGKRIKIAQISKALTTLPRGRFASRLASLTGDADYPRAFAGKILEAAGRVSPGLSGARSESREFLARAAALGTDAGEPADVEDPSEWESLPSRLAGRYDLRQLTAIEEGIQASGHQFQGAEIPLDEADKRELLSLYYRDSDDFVLALRRARAARFLLERYSVPDMLRSINGYLSRLEANADLMRAIHEFNPGRMSQERAIARLAALFQKIVDTLGDEATPLEFDETSKPPAAEFAGDPSQLKAAIFKMIAEEYLYAARVPKKYHPFLKNWMFERLRLEWFSDLMQGQSLGAEGGVAWTPIHPLLGVRLAETLFILKDPVLWAAGQVNPDFLRAQSLFHFTDALYARYLKALERHPTPEGKKIAAYLRQSPTGLQELKDIFESRERGAVMYLFENSILRLPPSARRAFFAQAAFTFAANLLEDEREQYYATNFMAQVLQPTLQRMESSELTSVDELHATLLEVLGLAGPFLLPDRILTPLRNSLDHMKAHWESIFAAIERNYDRYYVEPVPASLGLRLSPEVVVLHHEIFAALGKVFPGFAEPSGGRTVSPEQYFEFLQELQKASTPSAAAVYQGVDKTGQGRARLALLLGPGAGNLHFIDAAELADPQAREAKLRETARKIAPGASAAEAVFEALRAAYELHGRPPASSLGQSADGKLLGQIMEGALEPLERASTAAGLPRWKLEPAGRNLIYLLGLPEKAGEDAVRVEIIKRFQTLLADGVWVAERPDGDSWQTHHEAGFGLFVSRHWWDSLPDKRELVRRLVLETVQSAPEKWNLDLKRIRARAADIPLETLAGNTRPDPQYLTAAYRQMGLVLARVSRQSGVDGSAAIDLLDLLEKTGTSRALFDLFRSRLKQFEEELEAAMNRDFHATGLKKEMGNSDDGFKFEALMNRIRGFAARWGVIHHPEKRRSLRYLSDAFHLEKAFLGRWIGMVELYLNPDKETILREKFIAAHLANDLKEMEEQYGVEKVPAAIMRQMREALEKSVPRDNSDSYFQIKVRRILDEEPAKILAEIEARYRHWIRNFFHHAPPREWELDAQLATTVQVFADRSEALVRDLRPLLRQIPVIEFIPEPEGMSLGAAPTVVVESPYAGVLAPLLRALLVSLFEPGALLAGYDITEIRVKLGTEKTASYDPVTRKATVSFRSSADLYRSVNEIGKSIKHAVGLSRLRVVQSEEITAGKTAEQINRLEKAFKEIWLTDEWQAALAGLGPYQGLDLKNVRTFVLERTAEARVPPPQAIPESNALRIFLSDNDNMGSLRAILNQPPIRIEVAEWSRYLEEIFPDAAERERIVERIRRTVSWEDFNPDALSGTRAVVLRLERPVVYRGVTYHAIKIKGITFAGIFQPLKRPHHAGAQSTRADDAGRLVHEEDVNFQGGAPETQVRREFEGVGRGFEDGITLDVPLAHGIYPDFEYQGERGGFMVSLIQDEKDPRIEDSFNAYLRELMPNEEIEPEIFARAFREKGDIYGIRSYIDDFFRRAGRALRDAHDKGYYFMYPHFGNLTEYQGRFYWHDFDSWEDLRGVPAAREIGYRFFDLFQVFNHLEQFSLFSDDTLAMFSGLFGIRPVPAILEGYFYDRVADERVWEVQDKDALLALRMRIADRPIPGIEHPVIGLLEDIVGKKTPPRPNVPPHIPAVYVYPKQHSQLDQLLHGVARDMIGHRNRWFQIFRRLGVRSVSLAENYDDRMIAEYRLPQNEVVVAVPRGTAPRRAAEMIEKSFQTLAAKVREDRVLAAVNTAGAEELRALLNKVRVLGPQAKGGGQRVQAVLDRILGNRPFSNTRALGNAVRPHAVLEALEREILGSSLGAEEVLRPEFGAAAQVARDALGNLLDPSLKEDDFASLYAILFPHNAASVRSAAAAFNEGLGPALAHLGLRLNRRGVPLIVEEDIAGPRAGAREARKIIRTAGPGGAVILLWDFARHQGRKPALRRHLDRLAGRAGVQVRDFPLETVSGSGLDRILKAFDSPALALSSRAEALTLKFKGEKIRLDLKFFRERGIDPLQALALFKQIADHPAEKRRELFSRAGLDFDAAGGFWNVTARFAEAFLEKAYAAEAARLALSQAA